MVTGFTNDTNRGRVERMVETLGLLQKSARSNKADDGEIERLLIPMLAALGELGIVTTRGVPPPPVSASYEERKAQEDAQRWLPPGMQKPTWADVREMAEKAPLPELSAALAVYMNRVDEALAERR